MSSKATFAISFISALLVGAAILWHSGTGRFQVHRTAGPALVVLDTRTGELDLCTANEISMSFECGDDRYARFESERETPERAAEELQHKCADHVHKDDLQGIPLLEQKWLEQECANVASSNQP